MTLFAGFCVAIGFGCGYAFRGLIRKELATVAAEYTKLHEKAAADLTKIVADIKAKL